jgi:hypothetical protein
MNDPEHEAAMARARDAVAREEVRSRVRSPLTVDEAVAMIVAWLREEGMIHLANQIERGDWRPPDTGADQDGGARG